MVCYDLSFFIFFRIMMVINKFLDKLVVYNSVGLKLSSFFFFWEHQNFLHRITTVHLLYKFL